MILVIVLVVMGPERLPKVARQMGAAWRELTRVRQEVADEVRAALPDPEDLPRVPRIPSVRGTLTGFITDGAPKPATDGAKAGNGASAADGRTPVSPGNASADGFVPAADDPSMN